MDSNPLIPLDLEPVRDRVLTEISRVRSSLSTAPSPILMEEHFNKTSKVANKANALAEAISVAASKYFIPVDSNALDVVAAVKRKSADSPDGLRISFDLFKDAVECMQRQRKATEEEIVLSARIEPASVLEKRIRKLRARISLEMSGDEPDDDLLEMLVSQFILLFLAHELMRPFEELLAHLPLAQTWVEKSQGSSEVQILISTLIGLAIQLIIMQVNDDLMETYLAQAAGDSLPKGITTKDIISQARSLNQIRSIDLATQLSGINDYETILRYATDFLEKTTDPGYEMWTAYVDVVQMRYVAQSMWVYAPFYSVPHALYAESKTIRRINRKVDNSSERNRLLVEKALLEGLFPMANASYLAREDVLDKLDDNLNLIAQVLSSDFVMEVACCLGRVLGKVPVGSLKAMRSLLYGLLRAYAFDLSNIMQAIYSHLISPNFQEIIALSAMHEIDKIFDKIVSKVLGLFDNQIEALLCCQLIGELIKGILDIIQRLESELKGAIKIFVNQLVQSLGIGSMPIQRRYEVQYDQRIIRKMIMIIDAIIRAAENMDACSKDSMSPMDESLRSAIALPVIEINEDVRTNYFTTALPRELSSGKFLPNIGEKIESLLARAINNAEEGFEGKHSCYIGHDEEALKGAYKAFQPDSFETDPTIISPTF